MPRPLRRCWKLPAFWDVYRIAEVARETRFTMDAKNNLKARLPSRHVTEGPARAQHRSCLSAMCFTTEQSHQPFVGVASGWNEAAPCNISLMRQAQAAKK